MMNLKLNPLTPGYGIRWNTEFDSLRKLVAAQKVSLLKFCSTLPHYANVDSILAGRRQASQRRSRQDQDPAQKQGYRKKTARLFS